MCALYRQSYQWSPITGKLFSQHLSLNKMLEETYLVCSHLFRPPCLASLAPLAPFSSYLAETVSVAGPPECCVLRVSSLALFSLILCGFVFLISASTFLSCNTDLGNPVGNPNPSSVNGPPSTWAAGRKSWHSPWCLLFPQILRYRKDHVHPDPILLPSMNLHGGLVTYTIIRWVLMSLGSLVPWFWMWNRSWWPWGLLEQKRGQLSSRCCFHGQPRLQTLTGSTDDSPTSWILSRVFRGFNYPISCLPQSVCAAVTKDANPRCLRNTENLLLTVLEGEKLRSRPYFLGHGRCHLSVSTHGWDQAMLQSSPPTHTMVLEIELWVLCMLGRYFTTDLYPHCCFHFETRSH